jgi:hypothetical protein
MISIKKGSENLDMQPGTQLQRERQSPVFLDQTSDGKDGIPGEISYPFSLPLSDRNLRLMNYPDMLSISKELQHDVVLEDSGMQISAGKLILDGVTADQNKANVGNLDCHLLSNISEFWQRVKAKKLSDLALGGNRSFAWSGYSLVTAGFWKHCHDTWAYNDADDGDYVFAPMYCMDYEKEGQVTWINGWQDYSGTLQLAREKNFISLCPQPFVVYIIKQIFLEHGYSISGEILDDPDFKQICFESYRSVDWQVPTINGPLATPTFTIAPKNPVVIKLNQHVPPVMTVGEFLVELQKLLPIAFVINDRSKSCEVVLLSKLTNAGAVDRTQNFSPGYSIRFDKAAEPAIYGFERADDNPTTLLSSEEEYSYMGTVLSFSALPTPGVSRQQQMYYVKNLNIYYACMSFAEAGGGSGTIYSWFPVWYNVGSYLPGNQTQTIISNFAVSLLTQEEMPGVGIAGNFLSAKRKGNWYASGGDEFTPWPARLFFYRGKKAYHGGGTMPLATNSIYNLNASFPPVGTLPTVGEWSLSYKVGDDDFGIYDRFWKDWLPALELNELIKGRLYLKFHEYIQWDWSKVLLIQNTPYLIKKISEILPYAGYVDIEAQRIK